MTVSDWFLTPDERGNNATSIDRRHADGRSWTEGNRASLLVHGREYFTRLHEVLRQLGRDDWVHFTDWRGDPDERLNGPGTEVARVLADAAARGVHVRGLIWRSHPDQAHFSEQENLHLTETVNEAGGEVLLDERVRRAGSHHQKLFVVRRADDGRDDVAFAGGIDLCHGRNDDAEHRGDVQTIGIDPLYGPQPAWHDVQLEVRGPAVGDLAHTFRERWKDPHPLDSGAPWRARLARIAHEPRRPDPLPDAPPDPPEVGAHAIQVLRTYPARRPRYPFAPQGERSIARAYRKAFSRARSLIYVEDQYLWSSGVADALASALSSSPRLHLVAVVPRYPDENGRLSGPPNRIGQQRALARLEEAGGDRVAVYDLEAPTGWPIYVHAKVCIVDDTWMIVGSDNLNRRSWTHDSELSCAILDGEPDGREPADPGGQGDGARRLPRDTRLRLWREHLGRVDGDHPDLVDPTSGFEALRHAALRLEGWHATGCRGVRPAGRVRIHLPTPVRWWAAWWAAPLYRFGVDPDGRPWRMRLRDEF
ncbi:MAG: phospholipase D family protein [Acidimicrobiales bacterium]